MSPKRPESFDCKRAPSQHIDQHGGIEKDAHRLADTARVGRALCAYPSSRVGVPLMLGVGQRAYDVLDVLPATFVVQRTPDCCRDERTAFAASDAGVQSIHDLVIKAYVQTHGHTLAHAVIRPTFYIRPCALLSIRLG